MMNPEQPKVQWRQLIARTWRDEAFGLRLLADPTAVLHEQGLEVPAGVQVRVVEDTHQVIHLTLPHRPGSQGELADEDMGRVADGAAATTLDRGCHRTETRA
jgi:hypothetical protein